MIVQFHKPRGCITAKKDDRHRTVMEYFPEKLREQLHPVGRLDLDTEGILLLTDDGKLDERLLHPANRVPKRYFFRAFGTLDEEKCRKLESGIRMTNGHMTLPAKVTVGEAGKVRESAAFFPERIRLRSLKNPEGDVVSGELILTEGKTHEVKRMLQGVGCCVYYLKRMSIGGLELDPTIPPGGFRVLNEAECRALFAYPKSEQEEA